MDEENKEMLKTIFDQGLIKNKKKIVWSTGELCKTEEVKGKLLENFMPYL